MKKIMFNLGWLICLASVMIDDVFIRTIVFVVGIGLVVNYREYLNK